MPAGSPALLAPQAGARLPARPREIPTREQELTPEWLTRALRSGGALREARVVTAERERLDGGEGLMGDVLRLRLRYDHAEPEAPERLVAKLPAREREVRAAAELLGLYDREVRFYQELAPRVPVRVPRCFHADMDPNPGERFEERALRWIDRAPGWLLPALWRLGRFGARHSRRRYVLLLEDVAPARTGDQVAGCCADEAAGALATLARLHAAFWQAPELARGWIRPLDTTARLLQVNYRRTLPGFEARFGALAGPHLVRLARWLAEGGLPVLRALAAPPTTFLHGDYRPDNIARDAARGENVLLDWQVGIRGRGVYDVAYFLCGALPAETPLHEERELVRGWHAGLETHGVADYPFAACWRDYELARLAMLQRLVPSTEAVDALHPRAEALLAVWLPRLAARLREADPDAILRRATPGAATPPRASRPS